MRILQAFALAAAFLTATLFAPASLAQTGAHPNIILVMADDLGYGDIGAFGATRIRTPNLDRMARQGAALTRFFASANVCSPSRAGLLTGRYPARSGMAVGVLLAHSTYGLPESEITLPEMLREAGYHTYMLGKWHLGSRLNFWPTNHGFDAFWGVPWSNDFQIVPLYRDTKMIEEPLIQETFTERLVDEARTIINNASDRPFFLYVAPIAPHVPLRPGSRFRGRSEAGLYGDAVEELDWMMGEIFTALRAAGKDRNSIVMFTSDNGPWFEGSSGDRRDRKGSTFEGAYAAPLIARWPARIPRGLRSDQMAMNIDILPTLTHLVGVRPPQDRVIDGRNIFPLLTERHARTPHERLLFFANENVAAIRTQDWRLVTRSYYQTFDAPLGNLGYRLLFNVQRDPHENYNVWDRHPDVVARLEGMMRDARAEFAAIPQQRPVPGANQAVQLPGEERPPLQNLAPILGDQPPMR
jgi:uncharacterized sulfatase